MTRRHPSDETATVTAILRHLFRHPEETLLRRWNWKSAVFSSLFRANLFLAVNLTAGRRAAFAAACAEFLFRFLTSGFYGSITQSFRRAEPPWAAVLVVMLLVPLVSHSLEFLLHWLRGTPNLRTSIAVSMAFTTLSTSFNWFAMRRGTLVVGKGESSIWSDLARVPSLFLEFICAAARLGRPAPSLSAVETAQKQ